MIHSYIDSDIWEEEFEQIWSQEHFDRMWTLMQPLVSKYIVEYLDEIIFSNGSLKPQNNISLHIRKLIAENSKMNDKYVKIFSSDLMEEYQEDVEGFKGHTLNKECPVIFHTWHSKAVALKDWKNQYKITKPQELYDVFYNIMDFASEYNEEFSEAKLNEIDKIDNNNLRGVAEDGCYLRGVIGTGIISTILNSMYPRVFPGHFKIGLFALYMLSAQSTLDMKTNSSEFIMVKDDAHSKTGVIEAEHNYYYSYATFGLYSLRIYRVLSEEIARRFALTFPDEYRYVLTNDFYGYVFEKNKEGIKTLLGNDDILKFTYL